MSEIIIRYTTDGSEPTINSPIYVAPIQVGSSRTIKAKAFCEGWIDSDTGTAEYLITGMVEAPTFNLTSGTYDTIQNNVVISCATSGAQIRYTTDGTTPTNSSPIYTAPLRVENTTTIKAIAFKKDWTTSGVSTLGLTMNVPACANPVIVPNGGTFGELQNVTITCETAGAQIRYTTDGSEPKISSPLYSSALIIDSTTTLKAKAFKPDILRESGVVTALFEILGTASAPQISHASGTYTQSIDVSMTCATQGAEIYYTLDGTEPVKGQANSLLYEMPVKIIASCTLKARSYSTGAVASSIVTKIYNITGKLPTPRFTPEAGTYQTSQLVTITVG